MIMIPEEKCVASQNGQCRNVYGFGQQCSGYSTQCQLRPTYAALAEFNDRLVEVIEQIVKDTE